MTREEREKAIKALKWFKEYNEEDYCGGNRIQDEHGDWYYRVTEQDFETFDMIIKTLEQEPILDKIRAEINKNIEQEDFARSVFINEEKDYRKANQCTGNIQAYEKVLDMIDNLLKENKDG